MHINSATTLFLDRDGVINVRLMNDYVKRHEEFKFLPGVLDALNMLSKHIQRIVIVTNQQGISKGLYNASDLEKIHAHMCNEIKKRGGKIDAVYFSPNAASENSPLRKPGIGMALLAKKDFPEIDFANSIMVGDSHSDMGFARNAGMQAVFVGDAPSLPEADMYVNSLFDFAQIVVKSYSR
jgi:histidinol-phosphate phosphatase family protein